MKRQITVWMSKSKTRPHNIESGERLIIDVQRSRRMKKLVLVRQFYHNREWEDAHSFGFSINRKAMEEVILALQEVGDSL